MTVWFVNPLFYHSVNGVWLFTPHPLELNIVNRDSYHQIVHSFNNFTLAISLPIIYLTFFLTRPKKNNQRFSNFAKRDISLFVQSMLVTGSVALCAGSYAFLELFDLSAELTKAAHFLWVLVEGAPSVVYLTLNQTILHLIFVRDQHPSTSTEVPNHSKNDIRPAVNVITGSIN
ncbi:unnamed protein product [Bursaphelenchus okinawaensis]|uniref:Serpentine receptor class gamma n=1 Tax=Bursaphelenchus okinawaensis TaxID=465554 RepID=A0A811LSR5_9BILA|nr:unnamed protein product [Bursaphelenchus okinawaensis]CAG9127898.1 unnamed protein product [Bursaphelenchus okinawaensis]